MEEESRDDPSRGLQKGFDKKLTACASRMGSKQLDASCLLISSVDFCRGRSRMIGTVEAIEKRLMKDGFVERYETKKTKDGLSGGEGAFLACSFWMVTSLWLMGRKADARRCSNGCLRCETMSGLLSEEMTRWEALRG